MLTTGLDCDEFDPMTWREPYMWVRWATVGIGQVITVDDDVLPPEVTINQLILFKQKQPDSLHSTHGRNAKPGCIYNYQRENHERSRRSCHPAWSCKDIVGMHKAYEAKHGRPETDEVCWRTKVTRPAHIPLASEKIKT